MDEQTVRAGAAAFGDALVDGDIERAIGSFSPELRRNLGEVIALLPLPASEATIESIEHSGSGENVVLRVVTERDETLLLTRWKERDGHATIIEVSRPTVVIDAADTATESTNEEVAP